MNMKNEEIRNMIVRYNSGAILFDDLDDAIIGIGQQHVSATVAIYDRDKCIELFSKQFAEEDNEDGPYLLAQEWFEYNIENAYVGANTPTFLTTLESIEGNDGTY